MKYLKKIILKINYGRNQKHKNNNVSGEQSAVGA
jgi:hypothetical protein